MGPRAIGREIAFLPRLLCEEDAAAYLGRSRNKFRDGVAARVLLQPSDQNGNRKLWDRRVLDRHVDALSGIGEVDNPWDSL